MVLKLDDEWWNWNGGHVAVCTKPILWELYSFLMKKLSFIPINLYVCWPRWRKRSICGVILAFWLVLTYDQLGTDEFMTSSTLSPLPVPVPLPIPNKGDWFGKKFTWCEWKCCTSWLVNLWKIRRFIWKSYAFYLNEYIFVTCNPS